MDNHYPQLQINSNTYQYESQPKITINYVYMFSKKTIHEKSL